VENDTSYAIHAGGIDLVDMDRFSEVSERFGSGLIGRVLSESEWTRMPPEGPDTHRHVAAFFGMKESTVKVLGGLPSGGSLTDIRIGPSLWHGGPRPAELTGTIAGRLGPGTRLVVQHHDLAPGLGVAWAFAISRVAR
jgi:holo-[acyl-carrier protein] synthase